MKALILQEFDAHFEVIAILDGPDSRKASSELKHEFQEYIALRTDASELRRGSPRAKNIGASLASGEYLVFLDDDTEPEPSWLRSLISAYSDGIVGVGGSERKPVAAGIARRIWITLNRNSSGRVTWSGQVISNFDPGKACVEEADCLAGCNMSFRRSEFIEIGGFDELYEGTSYREETDLCLRIRRKGRLLFVPCAVVTHHEESVGGNTPSSFREWNYWYHRNNTYFFLANFRPRSAFRWFNHILSEAILAVARTLSHRSIYPLSTMRKGIRDGLVLVDRSGGRDSEE